MNAEIFVHVQKSPWDDSYRTEVFSCDMSEHGYILLGSQTIRVNMPSMDEIILKNIAALHKKEQKLKADFVVAQEKIKDEIQSLHQIQHKEG